MGVPWFGWVGLVLNLVIIAAIVIGVILLIISVARRNNQPAVSSQVTPTQPPAAPNPREIAQTRYARGEITRDEYMQILTDLGN